jgi:cation diffusion facilitator family transporter
VAFAFTGSASMLAEGVHSIADSANQGLLLWGRRQARRPPTDAHPFGFGRERYFWAFVVSLVLFSGGGLFALLEGEEKLRHPHELSSFPWAVGVLLLAAVFEATSLHTARAESRPLKRSGESWLGFVRRSTIPELPVVLLEDSGALLGLLCALAGIVLAEVTGNARFDALGSLGIGVLLVAIAATLAVEMKSLLIGEAASVDQVRAISAALRAAPGVRQLTDLRTEHLGPGELLVVAGVVVDDEREPVEEVIDRAEAQLRDAVGEVRLVYLEPVDPPPEAVVVSRGRHGRGHAHARARGPHHG